MLCAPGGVILTLQNGVESEARLAEYFGRETIMAGCARVGAELVAPGQIMHMTTGVIEFWRSSMAAKCSARAKESCGRVSARGNLWRVGRRHPHFPMVEAVMELSFQHRGNPHAAHGRRDH